MLSVWKVILLGIAAGLLAILSSAQYPITNPSFNGDTTQRWNSDFGIPSRVSDDLLLGAQDPEIFIDGFETGDTSRWWTPETDCVSEGEVGSPWDGIPCCSGLIAISCSEQLPDGGCATQSDCFICSVCGDGICDLGENICNCPEDC